MNWTPITIFIGLMLLTWIGAYFAGKAGFMQHEKELLKNSKDKENV